MKIQDFSQKVNIFRVHQLLYFTYIMSEEEPRFDRANDTPLIKH